MDEAVFSIRSPVIADWYQTLDQEGRDLFNERAAILEHDCGMEPWLAERHARRIVGRLLKEWNNG